MISREDLDWGLSQIEDVLVGPLESRGAARNACLRFGARLIIQLPEPVARSLKVFSASPVIGSVPDTHDPCSRVVILRLRVGNVLDCKLTR